MSKVKTVSFFKIAVLLFVSFSFITSCGEKKKEHVDMQYEMVNRDYQGIYTPIVEMPVNGKMRYFIVDTGANLSMIDESFYQGNKEDFNFLKEIEMTINGVSGSASSTSSYINTVLGDSITILHSFVTNDLTGVVNNIRTNTGKRIVGIIGADFLNRYDFNVDFFNNMVYVKQDTLTNKK